MGQIVGYWLDIYILVEKQTTNTDSEVFSKIYELLTQVLDPCHIFNSIQVTRDIQVGVESVVSGVGLIYDIRNNNSDITDQFSNLITNINHVSILYDLIDSIISYISHHEQALANEFNYKDEFYQLIENSLFISQSISIAITIPSEIYSNKLNNFETYSIRIDNKNNTFNHTINNIDILINYPDTNIGRIEFEMYHSLLNSVDIITFVLNSNKHHNSNSNNNNSHSTINNETNYLSQRLSLTILSNQTATVDKNEYYKLKENASIIFLGDNYYNSHDEYIYSLNESKEYQYYPQCVWYNISGNIWQNDGCITQILLIDDTNNIDNSNYNVLCQCNHLTTFALLWGLEVTETEEIVETYKKYRLYSYGFLVLSIAFICVAVFLSYIFIKLIKNKIFLCGKGRSYTYETAYGALFLTLIQSILQMNICLTFYGLITSYANLEINNINNNNNNNDIDLTIVNFFKQYLIASLLLPIIVSYYIFSHVIYGVYIVSISMSPYVNKKKKYFGNVTLVSNIFITIIFVMIIVALLFDFDTIVADSISFIDKYHIFSIFVISFCVITFIVAILIGVYSIKAVSIITKTLTMINKNKNNGDIRHDGDDDITAGQHKGILRIKIGSISAMFVLTFQSISTIYFTIYPPKFFLTIFSQIIEVTINLVFCCVIIFVYHHYAAAKITEKKELGLKFVICNFEIYHMFLSLI